MSDASTRGTLGIVTGPSGGDKAEAEQALLDRALLEYAWVFTWRRLWVLDRNFPGVARIKRLTAVTHVLVRLKSDITVTRIGDFLPDGSYMADVGGKDGKTRMRVIEYYVEVEGQDPRRRPLDRADLPVAHPGHDPPGTRRLDHRHDIRALIMHHEHDHRP